MAEHIVGFEVSVTGAHSYDSRQRREPFLFRNYRKTTQLAPNTVVSQSPFIVFVTTIPTLPEIEIQIHPLV